MRGTLRIWLLVFFSFWMLLRVDSVPLTSFTSVEPRYSAMYLSGRETIRWYGS